MTPEQALAKAEALGLEARLGYIWFAPSVRGLMCKRPDGYRFYLTDEMIEDTPFAEAFLEEEAKRGRV
jgi:hypothetical protein